MKVNTDGVLLGALMSVRPGDRSMLDVGTGTGTIALMAAQRISDMHCSCVPESVPETVPAISDFGQDAEQCRILAIDIDGPSAREARAEALSLLADLGLSERAGHKPSELSGGEQQRVAIARALINHPAVIFADEPSGNLDSATKKDLHSLFFRLRDELGQTIVIVTHDPELASMCDRSLFMRDGLFV